MSEPCKQRCMYCRFWQIEEDCAERRRRFESGMPWDQVHIMEPYSSSRIPYVWGRCRKCAPYPVFARPAEHIGTPEAAFWPLTNGEKDGCGDFEEGRWE